MFTHFEHKAITSAAERSTFCNPSKKPTRHFQSHAQQASTHTSAASFSAGVGSDKSSKAKAGTEEEMPTKSAAAPASKRCRRPTAVKLVQLVEAVLGAAECATKADALPIEHKAIT